MEYIIYKDNPKPDIWILLILNIPPVALVVLAVSLLAANLSEALTVLVFAFLLGLLNVFILPVAYCVYDDKIKIMFRVPVSFNIPFDHIDKITTSKGPSLGISLPTNLIQENVVEILRKKRMPVIITPADRDAFLDNFDKAFKNWRDQGRTIL
ncbi:MAG: hypothetical protein PHO26_02420 [Dehalococcoidia bacterium]|nr:hypothetical protein [Dehalococcoidia bacterium]MDD5494800.1 hypothetical protein [Dehalococcoidia bacterium]